MIIDDDYQIGFQNISASFNAVSKSTMTIRFQTVYPEVWWANKIVNQHHDYFVMQQNNILMIFQIIDFSYLMISDNINEISLAIRLRYFFEKNSFSNDYTRCEFDSLEKGKILHNFFDTNFNCVHANGYYQNSMNGIEQSLINFLIGRKDSTHAVDVLWKLIQSAIRPYNSYSYHYTYPGVTDGEESS